MYACSGKCIFLTVGLTQDLEYSALEHKEGHINKYLLLRDTASSVLSVERHLKK